MVNRIRRIRVVIPAHRSLQIRDPKGGDPGPAVTGRTALTGELRRLDDGLTWVLFPTQRGYGLPETDLQLAASLSGVTYRKIRTRVEETI